MQSRISLLGYCRERLPYVLLRTISYLMNSAPTLKKIISGNIFYLFMPPISNYTAFFNKFGRLAYKL